ncbi:hypothetical protein [Aeromonas diversa]|nr:hypothetical protein [Aeromonas diversa]
MRHKKRQLRHRQLWFSHWNGPVWHTAPSETAQNRQIPHSSR